MRILIVRSEVTTQKDLLRLLERNGWWKAREGANHMVYTNGKESEMIPPQRIE